MHKTHRTQGIIFADVVDDSGGKEVVGKRVVTSMGIVIVSLIAHILVGFQGLVIVCSIFNGPNRRLG